MTRPFSGTQRLSTYTRDQTIDVIVGEEAAQLWLLNTPGGTLPGQILATKVQTVTNWDVARDARYEAQ